MLTPRRKFLISESFKNMAVGKDCANIYIMDAVYGNHTKPRECGEFMDGRTIIEYLYSSGLDWDKLEDNIHDLVYVSSYTEYHTYSSDGLTVELKLYVSKREEDRRKNPVAEALERFTVAAGIRGKSKKWCSITRGEEDFQGDCILLKINIPKDQDWSKLPSNVYRFMLLMLVYHSYQSKLVIHQ